MPSAIALQGRRPDRAKGTDTTVLATSKAIRWARPVQLLTARTAAGRWRHKVTALEMAPSASLASLTTKTAASESSQLNRKHNEQTIPAIGTKRTKAITGCESFGDEVKPAMIAEPARAANAASRTVTRRKFSCNRLKIRSR